MNNLKSDVERAMKRIIEKKYEEATINELLYLKLEVEEKTDEKCKFLSHQYSPEEAAELSKLMIEGIKEELKKSHTFLETARLLEALDALDEVCDKEAQAQNQKIQICLRFMPIFVEHYGQLPKAFKEIALLDC